MGNVKSTDERLADLEQTVAYLSRLVLKARRYAESDPEVALGQARKSAEAICYRLFQAEIGPPGKMMLEDLMTKLQAKQVLPPHVVPHLRAIQTYGNFGVHAQEGHGEVSVEWVAPCLSALAQVTNWYFRDYLGIALPTALERHEDHSRPVPRHGGRETQPRVESITDPPRSGQSGGPASVDVRTAAPVAGVPGGETCPERDQTPDPAGPIESAHPPRTRSATSTPLRLVALAGALLLLVLGGIYLNREVRNDPARSQDQATVAVLQAEAQAEQQQALAADIDARKKKLVESIHALTNSLTGLDPADQHFDARQKKLEESLRFC